MSIRPPPPNGFFLSAATPGATTADADADAVSDADVDAETDADGSVVMVSFAVVAGGNDDDGGNDGGDEEMGLDFTATSVRGFERESRRLVVVVVLVLVEGLGDVIVLLS